MPPADYRPVYKERPAGDRRADAPESWWTDPVIQADYAAFAEAVEREWPRMRVNASIVPPNLNLS